MAGAGERNSYSSYSKVRSIADPGVSLVLSSAAVGCFCCAAGCADAEQTLSVAAVNPTARKANVKRERVIRSSAAQSLSPARGNGHGPVAQACLFGLRLFFRLQGIPSFPPPRRWPQEFVRVAGKIHNVWNYQRALVFA